jgi:hypothetical protein
MHFDFDTVPVVHNWLFTAVIKLKNQCIPCRTRGGKESFGTVLSENFGFPLLIIILLMLHIKL